MNLKLKLHDLTVSTYSDNIGQQYQAAAFQIHPKNRAKVTKFYLSLATCAAEAKKMTSATLAGCQMKPKDHSFHMKC